MSLETSKWEPTLDENIDMKFGKEPIEKAEQISKAILEQIKAGILNIGMKKMRMGEEEWKKAMGIEVGRYLEMWQEFADNLFARTSSINAKSPEVVKTAIDGANSLLTPDISGKDESATNMIEALKNRYGK